MKIITIGTFALFTLVAAAWTQTVSAATLTSSVVAITPNTLNATLAPTTSELVTIGVPLNRCVLTDPAKFRLLDDGGQEVPIFIKPTLYWPASSACAATSIRAVKVQFIYDATRGIRNYSWDLAGRNTTLRSEAAVSEIVTDNPKKGGRKEPRVFGIVDPVYLVQSGIVPPTSVANDEVYDTGYLPELWEANSLALNYGTSGSADWLFDRVSTNYRQALRRGALAYYREAYLSHEWYISKMEVTGTNTSVVDYCLGGFDFGSKATTFGAGGDGCDTKYIYPLAYKLHLALTGDDSWKPSENGVPSASGNMGTREKAWNTIARLLVTGDVRGGSTKNEPGIPAAGFIKPYTSLSTVFTERDAGFGLQAVLNVCELSLDATVCGWVDTIIDNVRQMQIANPDGIEHYGYLSHSQRQHEGGGYLPWIGSLVTSYTSAQSITVQNTFGDDYKNLTAGKTIRIGSNQNYKLETAAINNGNGTWTLNLVTPVTASANTAVNAVYLADGKTIDLGHPTDRMFSPWMQAIIGDAIWQYYNWTNDSIRKEKAGNILLGFARAYTAYALDGSQLSPVSKTLIEQSFDDFGAIKIFSAPRAPRCSVTRAPYTGYFANVLMVSPQNNQAYLTYFTDTGAYNHDHIPEGFFQLSLGVLFETDFAKKAAMQAVLSDMYEWFEKYACTVPVTTSRAYAWSNRMDPVGTYNYVKNRITAPAPSNDPIVQAVTGKGLYNAYPVVTGGGATTAAYRIAASLDNGVTVQTEFAVSDQVTIAGSVEPQLNDIGVPGIIVVVVRTITPAGEMWFYRASDGSFKRWDNYIASLEPAYATDALQSVNTFEIFAGKLPLADHRVFVGYRRSDSSVLHYTGTGALLKFK